MIGLHILIGAPGAGKTTWAATHAAPETVLSLDAYRAQLTGTEADQSRNAEAVVMRERALRARLAEDLPCIIDATSTLARDRVELLATAAEYGVDAAAIVFTTSVEECLRRNAARDRRVPEDVIVRKAAEVAALTESTLIAEGFQSVTFI